MNETEIQDLGASFHGELIAPGAEAYEAPRGPPMSRLTGPDEKLERSKG